MIIKAKLDLMKIPKDKIYIGQKGKYLDIIIFQYDEQDKYGNDFSIQISRSQEERESGGKAIYIGNGKIQEHKPFSPVPPKINDSFDGELEFDDDLPF